MLEYLLVCIIILLAVVLIINCIRKILSGSSCSGCSRNCTTCYTKDMHKQED